MAVKQLGAATSASTDTATKGYVDSQIRAYEGNAISGTAVPTSFGDGLTYGQVDGSANFPVTTGTVLVVMENLNRAYQMVVSKDGTQSWLRGVNGTDAWGPWVAQATTVPTPILSGANLDDYTTPGLFHQASNASAGAGTNYPLPYAGLLEVFAVPSSFYYQRYSVYGPYNRVFFRTRYNVTWSAWVEVVPPSAVTNGAIQPDALGGGMDNLLSDPLFLNATISAYRTSSSPDVTVVNAPGSADANARSGAGYAIMGSASSAANFYLKPNAASLYPIPVVPGRTYRFGAWLKSSADFAATSGFRPTMQYKKTDGSAGYVGVAAYVKPGVAYTWYEWSWTALPDAAYCSPAFQITGRTAGSIYVTQPIFMPAASGHTHTMSEITDAEAFVDYYNETPRPMYGSPQVGTVTAGGARTKVSVNTNYNAFPGLTRCADGSLLLSWRDAALHGWSPGSKTTMSRSTDFGQTWSTPWVVFYDAAKDTGFGMLTTLSDGRIACIGQVRSQSATTGAYCGIMFSSDHGATFGSVITIPFSFTDWTYAAGNVLELTDGTLLAIGYGQNTGATYTSTRVMRSTNGGTTWTNEVTVANGPTAGRPYNEATLGYLPNGQIMALIRDETTGDTRIWKATSSDGGLTWSALTNLFPGWGRPAWTSLASGGVVMTYRAQRGSTNDDSHVYRTSWDNGVTWTGEALLAGVTPNQSVYSQLLEVAPGLVATAYAEDTPAIGNVYFKYLMDGVGTSPLGDTSAQRELAQIVADTVAVTDGTERLITGLSVGLQCEDTQRYRIEIQTRPLSTVAGDRLCVRIRRGSLTGPIVDEGYMMPGYASVGQTLNFAGYDTPGEGWTTWYATFSRAGGTGSARLVANAASPSTMSVKPW